jgi:U3 small nucleolar RNA-associated protein 13
LDNHVDRVWALAVKPPPILSAEEARKREQNDRDVEMVDGEEAEEESQEPTFELVSGSADSTLTFWTDTTATTALQATTQATARIEQDQELQNHIRSQNYREAIVLALQLNHPKRLLDLFTAVVNGPQESGSCTGRKEVDAVIAGLSDSQLWNLLKRLRDWNANARTYNVAQHILYAILRLHPKERLLNLRRRRKVGMGQDGELADAMANLSTEPGVRDRESVKDVLDGLKAYTERHYARLEKMGEERFVLLWALQQMDGVGGEVGVVNGHVGEMNGIS